MRLIWVGVLAVLAGNTYSAKLVNGAGATFPYPLYSKWFAEYQKIAPEANFNYQSIGSGGGIRQFSEKTIDFGASDAPMTDEQMTKAGAPVVHVPTVLGAVVVTFNVAGVAALKLTPEIVAGIYLGAIKRWEDAKIARLNPGLTHKGDIVVVHRSDGSGTSAIFTDYLSKVSADWKSKVGAGTAVNWPAGLGGKGNEGVSGLVKQTPGSIGYVELIYARSNGLSVASIKNRAGAFVEASEESVTAAAAAALKSMPADFRVSITDALGKGAYPISGFTYLLVWKDMSGSDKGDEIVRFLRWAVRDGQKLAAPLHYAPLPTGLVGRVESRIAEIQVKKLN